MQSATSNNITQNKTESNIVIDNQKALAIYEKYVSGWGPISDDERAKITAEILDEHIQYITPRHEIGGRATAIEDMKAFQKKFPGGHFEVRDVSAHHNVALLTWDIMQADGKSFAKGHDQISISKEGKILSLITFAPSVSTP